MKTTRTGRGLRAAVVCALLAAAAGTVALAAPGTAGAQDAGVVCTGFAVETDGTGLALTLAGTTLTAGITSAEGTNAPDPASGPRATATGTGATLSTSTVTASAGENGVAPDVDDPPAVSGPIALPPSVPVVGLVTATGDAVASVDANGSPAAAASGEVSTITVSPDDLLANLPTGALPPIVIPGGPTLSLDQFELLTDVLGLSDGSAAQIQLGDALSTVTSNTTEATATSTAEASRIDLLNGILGPLVTLTVASPSATVTIAADGSTATADFTNPVITIETNPLLPAIIDGIIDAVVAGLPVPLQAIARPIIDAALRPALTATIAAINSGLDALPDQVQAGDSIDQDIIPGVLGLRLNIASGSATADGVVPAAAQSGVIDLGIRLAGTEVIGLVGGRTTAAGVPAGCTTIVPPTTAPPTTAPPTTAAPTTAGPGTTAPPAGPGSPPAAGTPLPRTGDDRPLRTATGLAAALLAGGALILTRRARSTA